MKVLLTGFSSPEHIAVVNGLQEKGVDVCYWVINRNKTNEIQNNTDSKGIIFQSSFDALRAIPADGIDVENLSYPEDEVFVALEKREMQILQMMSQLDFSDIGFLEKKRIYFSYIRYWYGILKKFAPDAVLFVDIPHVSYNLVLYEVARYMGIKTIMFKRAKGLPDLVLFFNDFETYPKLVSEYQQQLQKNVTLADLSEPFQNFYNQQNAPVSEEKLKFSKELYTYIPDKIRATKILPSGKTVLKHLKRLNFFGSLWSYVWMVFHKTEVFGLQSEMVPYWKVKLEKQKHIKASRKFKAEYESLQVSFDETKKFIYVPLHLQPECTTNPQGGIFDDQILMLEVLSKSLPSDWIIYVKENPLQWMYDRGFYGRYEGYYQAMTALHNVRLLPLGVSTFDLIVKSQAVATITGTAGWEAIVRGKPTLVFGYTWYQDCDGVFKVKSVEECSQAIQKIQSGSVPEKNKVIAFLKAVEVVGIRGYSNKKFGKLASVSPEENIRNFVQAFYSELTQ